MKKYLFLFLLSFNVNAETNYLSANIYNIYVYDTDKNSYLYLRDGYNAIVNLKYAYSKDNYGLYLKVSNKYNSNKLEIDYVTGVYNIGFNNIEISNKIGIVDSYDGFFSNTDTIEASGMLLLPLGVYNYKYTNTYLGNVFGYKGEISYNKNEYFHKFILLYGNQYIRDKDKAFKASFGKNINGINYKINPTLGIGYIGKYRNIGLYGKWVHFDFNLFLSGDPMTVYMQDPALYYLTTGNNNYSMDIYRKGIVYDNYKWQFYLEKYDLKLTSQDHKFGDEFDSSGYYIVTKRNFDYCRLWAGYSTAKQKSSKYTSNDVFGGISYQVNHYTNIMIEYHHTNSYSWLIHDSNNKSNNNNTVFFAVNFTFEKYTDK